MTQTVRRTQEGPAGSQDPEISGCKNARRSSRTIRKTAKIRAERSTCSQEEVSRNELLNSQQQNWIAVTVSVVLSDSINEYTFMDAIPTARHNPSALNSKLSD